MRIIGLRERFVGKIILIIPIFFNNLLRVFLSIAHRWIFFIQG